MILAALAATITVKVAVLYVDERRAYFQGTKFTPTYRVSCHLYPAPTFPKFSVALSEVGKDGAIKPALLIKSR